MRVLPFGRGCNEMSPIGDVGQGRVASVALGGLAQGVNGRKSIWASSTIGFSDARRHYVCMRSRTQYPMDWSFNHD
jgi:hypothetical protein